MALREEFGYLVRFVIAGGLNTVIGLGSIFVFMHVGLSPLVANAIGYALGLVVAFFTSRMFVFRSTGKKRHDGVKYLVSFSVAFGVNLLVLHAGLTHFQLGKNISQLLAIAAYVGTMFILSRLFVFNQRN